MYVFTPIALRLGIIKQQFYNLHVIDVQNSAKIFILFFFKLVMLLWLEWAYLS